MSSARPADHFPVSATAAWWLTAWLRGDESTDSVIDVVGPSGRDGGSVLDLLGLVRGTGRTGAGLALPVPGDPLGLGGPIEFNTAALEVGEAVVVGDLALVPDDHDPPGWLTLRSAPRPLPDLREASTGLRHRLLHAADGLGALDVAQWRPEVADLLIDLRDVPDLAAPAGIPDECLALAGRGVLARTVVALALDDDGGARTAHEITARRELLRPLDHAARRAIVAACSSEVWPTPLRRIGRDNL